MYSGHRYTNDCSLIHFTTRTIVSTYSLYNKSHLIRHDIYIKTQRNRKWLNKLAIGWMAKGYINHKQALSSR